MFKTVLVPLDGSTLGELALVPALHLARQSLGVLYLMRVPVYSERTTQVSPDLNQALPQDVDLPEYDNAAEYLREVRARLTKQGVTIRTTVVEGERANAIVNTALTTGADMIVMATHARSGLPRLLMGSVAGSLVRHTNSPILLVRKPTELNHILITLDGSAMSEQIIATAMEIAKAFGSRVTLLRVVDGANKDRKNMTSEDAYLKALIARYAPADLDVEAVVLEGGAVNEILALAARENIDLIAMATHGRSGLSKLIFGSVTEKIMCDSGCAMLVVRP